MATYNVFIYWWMLSTIIHILCIFLVEFPFISDHITMFKYYVTLFNKDKLGRFVFDIYVIYKGHVNGYYDRLVLPRPQWEVDCFLHSKIMWVPIILPMSVCLNILLHNNGIAILLLFHHKRQPFGKILKEYMLIRV